MIRKIRCLLLLLLLGGAAAGGCIPKQIPPPLVERVPYKILLHSSSALPDPYYVLSGPFQSYQRFQVNASFQQRLEAYLSTKSDPGASQTVELGVHIIKLQTSYDRLGHQPTPTRPVRLAALGLGIGGRMPLSAFDGLFGDQDDDRPQQITKTARLHAQITIKRPDQSTLREEIIGRSIQILEREDMGLRPHEYSSLIAEVQAAAIVEIDRLLDQALRPGVRPALGE